MLPGLSTAEKVSDISGRGVGMDVVKTNLDRLGGKAEIKSEVGKGSLFRIKLPLTLAIIPSLIVSIEGERFAIPQINVEELLRIRAEEVKSRIEVVGEAEVLLLRDRIIPLVRFDESPGSNAHLCRSGDGRTGSRPPHESRRPALTPSPDKSAPRRRPTTMRRGRGGRMRASAAGRRQEGKTPSAAGTLEIAVVTTGTYPVRAGGRLLPQHRGDRRQAAGTPPQGPSREYAGATILGDGTVALIMDVAGLATKAELVSVSGSDRAMEQAEEAEREEARRPPFAAPFP